MENKVNLCRGVGQWEDGSEQAHHEVYRQGELVLLLVYRQGDLADFLAYTVSATYTIMSKGKKIVFK